MSTRVRRCYFCTTPFQIISAAALSWATPGKFDLYVVNQFEDSDQISSRIRETGIFRQVKHVDETAIQPWRHVNSNFIQRALVKIREANTYLNPKKFYDAVVIPCTTYDEVYISSNAYTGRIVSKCMMKKNQTEIVLFDDGTGSYCNNERVTNARIEKAIQYLAFGPRVVNVRPRRVLYSPELYHRCGILPQDATIEEIPRWGDNQEFIHALDYIFDFTEENIGSERAEAILFESFENELLDVEGYKNYLAACSIFDFTFGCRFSIKIHPRNANARKNYSDKYQLLNIRGNVPVELYYAHLLAANGEVLFAASFSTAVFTPKLIFDKEPYVILLYKLTGSNALGDVNTQSFVNAIESMHYDKTKIICPRTMDELRDTLSVIKPKLGGR